MKEIVYLQGWQDFVLGADQFSVAILSTEDAVALHTYTASRSGAIRHETSDLWTAANGTAMSWLNAKIKLMREQKAIELAHHHEYAAMCPAGYWPFAGEDQSRWVISNILSVHVGDTGYYQCDAEKLLLSNLEPLVDTLHLEFGRRQDILGRRVSQRLFAGTEAGGMAW